MRFIKALFLAAAFSILFSQCYYWTVPRGISNLRSRIEQAERKEFSATAKYHLTLARELFQAAEKQYEDADFTSANQYIKQAKEQLNRANELSRLTP